MIYKTLFDDIKHNRFMIDIKKLNQVFVKDVYFLLFQIEIIALISECFYIICVDDVLFFYQWRIQSVDRYK